MDVCLYLSVLNPLSDRVVDSRWPVLLIALVLMASSCGSSGGDGSGDGAEVAPLVLSRGQLEEVVLTVDDVAGLIGAEDVEVSEGSFFLGLAADEAGEFPPGVEVEAREYWSLDLAETEAAGRGGRTLGVGPVDYVSVILWSAAGEPNAELMFDRVTSAEPEYTRWVPITVRGAMVAEQAVGIPYEGEPDDEPLLESVLARTDTLVVGVVVSGSDTDALAAAAASLAELIFERAREVTAAAAAVPEGDATGAVTR